MIIRDNISLMVQKRLLIPDRCSWTKSFRTINKEPNSSITNKTLISLRTPWNRIIRSNKNPIGKGNPTITNKQDTPLMFKSEKRFWKNTKRDIEKTNTTGKQPVHLPASITHMLTTTLLLRNIIKSNTVLRKRFTSQKRQKLSKRETVPHCRKTRWKRKRKN